MQFVVLCYRSPRKLLHQTSRSFSEKMQPVARAHEASSGQDLQNYVLERSFVVGAIGRKTDLVAPSFLLCLLGQLCFMGINSHAFLGHLNWPLQASTREARPQASSLVLQLSLKLIREAMASNGSSPVQGGLDPERTIGADRVSASLQSLLLSPHGLLPAVSVSLCVFSSSNKDPKRSGFKAHLNLVKFFLMSYICKDPISFFS